MSVSMATLPSSRDFVTKLLGSLPVLPRDNAEANPLNDAPESVKKQLLSLQVLFPNEFLPALDLLDRRLVTRFLIGIEEPVSTTSDNAATNNNAAAAAAADVQMHDTAKALNTTTTAATTTPTTASVPRIPLDTSDTVHYVRSAQQRSSRFSTSYDSTISYEVHLSAWNCTCPAFAFSAFPLVHPEAPVPTFTPPSKMLADGGVQDENAEEEDSGALEWMFGGVSLGVGMPPVCKHLLACVLAERCSGVFGECVEERRVSVETAAGWAAGWGDS